MTLNLEYEPESTFRPGYVYFLHTVVQVQDKIGRYKIGLTKQSRLKYRIQELNGKQAAFPIDVIGWIEVNDCNAAEKCLHQHFSEYRKNGEWFDFHEDDLDEVYRAYGEVMAKYPINKDLWENEEEPLIAEGYDFFDSVNNYYNQYLGLEEPTAEFNSYPSSYQPSYSSASSSGSDDSLIGCMAIAIIGLIILGVMNIGKLPKMPGQIAADRGQSRIEHIDVLPDDGRFLPNHRIDASVIGEQAASIRTGPDEKKYPMIGEPLINETPIKTIKRSKNGWFLVQTESGTKGWVAGNLIR
jgi:T5orf172 domain